MVIREDTLLRTRLHTLLQNADLFRDIAKSTNNFLVAVKKCENSIGDSRIATEFKDEFLRATQIVPGNTRVEMVDGLELQTTVEEVQPCRAIYVHGGTEHLLREGFVDAQVSGGHGEVGECDLHVQWGCDHVRDQDEEDPTTPVRNGAVENAVAKPGPEERLAGNFKPAVPPRWASLGSLVAEKVAKAQDIEVKPAE